MSEPIPITVLGGYLGAGKTTVLNRLLADPGGRRLGVIVNDFGSLPIDVEALGGADRSGLVSLPNGCVCCTLGADLHDALRRLSDAPQPPDHIVIEASGVADPAVAAAWGTSDGFAPGGVIVLAAADTVRTQAGDRYVGGEVVRQLNGADVLIVTKTDRCDATAIADLDRWLDETAAGIPRVVAVDGDVPTDLVLGVRPDRAGSVRAGVAPHVPSAGAHTDRYVTWSWVGGPVAAERVTSLADDPPVGLLRLKGVVETVDGDALSVQVVGRTGLVREATRGASGAGTRLVAIGRRDALDVDALDARFA